MDHFLFLFIGIVVGFFGGITVFNLINPLRQKADQSNFSALESAFEHYIDELTLKQEEIREELLRWKQEFEQERKKYKQSGLSNTEFSKSQLVMELMSEGYDCEQIAKKLGIGKGEVELISHLNTDE